MDLLISKKNGINKNRLTRIFLPLYDPNIPIKKEKRRLQLYNKIPLNSLIFDFIRYI